MIGLWFRGTLMNGARNEELRPGSLLVDWRMQSFCESDRAASRCLRWL